MDGQKLRVDVRPNGDANGGKFMANVVWFCLRGRG